jgi:hypothetical protein
MSDIQSILIEFKKIFPDVDIAYLYFLAGVIPSTIVAYLWKLFRLLNNRRNVLKISKDLHPYFTNREVSEAVKFYISTNGQNIAPSKEFEPKETHAFVTREKLLPFFLNKAFNNDADDQRFYMILADSGMGKTTFLINLLVRYRTSFFKRKHDIKLLPLSNPDIWKEIEDMNETEKRDTILLLDAFDEDNEAVFDYAARLDYILSKVKHFREVVITCRTQFFPKEVEEPDRTDIKKNGGFGGYHRFRKIYISPFDDKDIKRYLTNKYGIFKFWNYKKKLKADKLVRKIPNLVVRPMLLNYIDVLLESNKPYKYTYEIYDGLINGWITRESLRVKPDREARFKEDMYDFSSEIAIDIYDNRISRNGLFVDLETIKKYNENDKLEVELWEMTSRSLLNRDGLGMLKFSHKSILEYFLAVRYFNNSKFRKQFSFEGMSFSKLLYLEMVFENHFIKMIKNEELVGTFKTSKSLVIRDLKSFEYNLLNKIHVLYLTKFDSLDIDLFKLMPNLSVVNFGDSFVIDKKQIRELINKNSISFGSIRSDYRTVQRKLIDLNKIIPIIMKFDNLTGLTFSNYDIKSIETFNQLSELDRLKYINIRGNNLVSIEALTELVNLEQINLSDNAISDLSPLMNHHLLRHLVLYSNNIPENQITDLKSKLPKCKIDY